MIEKAYTHGTNFQKCLFVEEFYGNEFALFKAPASRKLADVIKLNEEKREQILKNIMEVINVLLTKGLIYLSISHHVLKEFFANGTPDLIREMTTFLAPEMIHTVRSKFGAQAAAQCAGYATAKERKIIIKSLKGSVVPICQEPSGHMVIVKLLSVTDDTVLLSKAIVKEMLDGADLLVTDGNGRLPFLHVLAPEGNLTRYFAPSSMELLAPNTLPDASNEPVSTSKKDFETRRQELLSVMGAEILAYCAKSVKKMISDKFGFAVLLEALMNVPNCDKGRVVNEIKRLIKRPGDEEDHVMSDPVASRLIKTLVATDFKYQDLEEGLLLPLPPFLVTNRAPENVSFAEAVAESLEGEFLRWASTDYASAVILALLKNPTTSSTLLKGLKPHRKALEKAKETRGTAAILEVLQ